MNKFTNFVKTHKKAFIYGAVTVGTTAAALVLGYLVGKRDGEQENYDGCISEFVKGFTDGKNQYGEDRAECGPLKSGDTVYLPFTDDGWYNAGLEEGYFYTEENEL